jgi:CheY-like chemotaxis protein
MACVGHRWNDSLQGVCVLVVEHEQDGQRLLASLLRYCGAYVKAASSAKEALEHTEKLLPDAIVIRLLDADMFSLIGRIRMREPADGGTVPIVGVGGQRGEGAGALPGCDVYLVEPIDPWALCRIVLAAVTGRDA